MFGFEVGLVDYTTKASHYVGVKPIQTISEFGLGFRDQIMIPRVEVTEIRLQIHTYPGPRRIEVVRAEAPAYSRSDGIPRRAYV